MQRATITDPDSIDVLMDASRVRLLEPFMVRPRTVVEAAQRRGVSASAMLYWVKRFVALGLLREVEGRKPATYAAAADEYVFDPTRSVPFEAVLERQYSATWNRMLRGLVADYRRVSEDWVMRVYLDGHGLICREGVPAWLLDRPAEPLPDMALNTWGVLRLPRASAAEFQSALEEVFERFSARATDEGDEYLVHIGFVHAPPE